MSRWYLQKPLPRFVKCIDVEAGWQEDRRQAKRYLQEGKVYTVERVSVLEWVSYVNLIEFSDVDFNTVHFDLVEEKPDEIVRLS